MYYATTDSGVIRIRFSAKEPGSALTHLIGVIYSIILTPILLIRAAVNGANLTAMIACSVFMLSMIMLYSASTIYHSFNLGNSANTILKKMDHLMIFVLIAGSYTPLCLTALIDTIGKPLLIIVWSLAAIGMLFKLFWINCPKWLSSVIYIGLGWACMFVAPALIKALTLKGFLWLLGGGILYTVGGVIYALKLKHFNSIHKNFGSHEIFHIFVMVGNLCQFWCIFKYCI